MAIQERNAAAVNLLSNDLVRNQGELHLSTIAVNATPYAAGGYTLLVCTTGAVNLIVNLPQVNGGTGVNIGKTYAIKKADAGAGQVVVTPFAGDTIDGAGSRNVVNQWDVIIITAGATTVWYVISVT